MTIHTYAQYPDRCVEERRIANDTRQRNLPGLRGYIRAATAFDDVGKVLVNPATPTTRAAA